MTKKKRQRPVSAEDIIAWVWENDDPSAPTCESRHLDVSDQSVEAAELRVYDALLAFDPDHSTGNDSDPESLDRTLTNILVFADDCRAATEWLENGVVSHDDEQGRRAGERRRHLKERGLLDNDRRFVRLCGQVTLDPAQIAVMATRQCVDFWEETDAQRSLHFKKCEAGIRWQPCTAETGRRTRLLLANPLTAPRAGPEADGRRVIAYEVSISEDEEPTAERQAWENTEADDVDEHTSDARWVLNSAGETAMEWLAEAAETAAEITMENDDETVRDLFPSRREMRRREERYEAQKRADEARKRNPTTGPSPGGPSQSIH